jgi:hypothetical protein
MIGIQFRPSFYIAQNSPTPEPAKAPEKSPQDQKVEEKTKELIRENIPAIKGEPLLKEILMMGLIITEDHTAVIKNEANETGFPQLCKGILWLSFEDNQRFKKIKSTVHGPISIEEIAKQVAINFGKRKIWFIRDFETYQTKENQEKLKAVILKIWNSKNGGEAIKDFKDILEK